MRIAVYGNNLNQGYWLVRGLRRSGIDATLLMLPYAFDQDHHAWWSDKAWDDELG